MIKKTHVIVCLQPKMVLSDCGWRSFQLYHWSIIEST